MIKQYFSQDKKTGYIRYYQFVTEDWIRITPTLWWFFGYALSQGTLYSQFRIELKWNEFLSSDLFDEFTKTMNYVFENEDNNEESYRIIVNSLRMVFDDWWVTYDYISQRPPCPLFKTDTYVNVDFVSKTFHEEDEEIDKYIANEYKVIPDVSKNNIHLKDIIRDDVKYNCFYSFLKGIISQQYSAEMRSEYNANKRILLNFHGKVFTTLFKVLLNDYNIQSEYDKFKTPTQIYLYENDGILEGLLDINSGFSNVVEPDIFISSPSRGIREEIN